MIDCPCGYGKNIGEEQNTCSVCGTDLTILHRLSKLKEVERKNRLRTARLKRTLVVVLPVGLLVGYITALMFQRPLSPEEHASEIEELISTATAFGAPARAKIDLKTEIKNGQIFITGEAPPGAQEELLAALAERATGKYPIVTVNLVTKGMNSAGTGITPAAPGRPVFFYTVKPRDSLARIAYRFYDDYSLWKRIYELNKDLLVDPDHLSTGQRLRIPVEPLINPAAGR